MDETKQKILIIEDDESLRAVLHDAFARAGFEILSAKNGQEGLDIALREHPDFVLLDIVMPVMDGIAALKKLREDEWGKHVPVFILTNSMDVETMAETMESHILQYIVKADVDMGKLVGQVQESLGQQRHGARRGSFGIAPSEETQKVQAQ
ncbi:response regulator [bacterium]|nr:response regulator [bacterium]